MSGRTPLIAGNWKMNLSLDASVQLVKSLAEGMAGMEGVEVLVAPPFTSLATVKVAIGSSGIILSAQNMHWEPSGACTGEISTSMLLEAGCTHVILGHSERRNDFGETSGMVDKKAEAAVANGLVPIVCIGEKLEEREANQTFAVIKKQLDESLKNFKDSSEIPLSLVLAYEPVWAIGTGMTASPEQAQEVHAFIRDWLKEGFDAQIAQALRILYGGSVKPDNVKDLMSRPDIDGALVGGASLKAEAFVPIIRFQDE
jgi:triosephosphate isomerase